MPSTGKQAAFLIDRRRLLAAAMVLMVPRIAAAQAAEPLRPLSKDMDSAEMASRMLAVLAETGRLANVSALYDALRLAGSNAQAIAAALKSDGEGGAKLLLRGWYTGLLPGPKGPILISYEDALMGRVVADLIPLRPDCGGAEHYWQHPPQVADLPPDNPRR
jgi:hypothetical protein